MSVETTSQIDCSKLMPDLSTPEINQTLLPTPTEQPSPDLINRRSMLGRMVAPITRPFRTLASTIRTTREGTNQPPKTNTILGSIKPTRRRFLQMGAAALGLATLSGQRTPEAATAEEMDINIIYDDVQKQLDTQLATNNFRIENNKLTLDPETSQHLTELLQNHQPEEVAILMYKYVLEREEKKRASENEGKQVDEYTEAEIADFHNTVMDSVGAITAAYGIGELLANSAVGKGTYATMVALNIIEAFSPVPGRREQIIHNAIEGLNGGAIIMAFTLMTKALGLRYKEDIKQEVNQVIESINNRPIDRVQLLGVIMYLSNALGYAGSTIVSSGVLQPLCERLALDPTTGRLDDNIMSALQGFIPNNSGILGLYVGKLGPLPINVGGNQLGAFEFIAAGGDIGPRVALMQEIGAENIGIIDQENIATAAVSNLAFVAEILSRLPTSELQGRNILQLGATILNPVAQWETYKTIFSEGIKHPFQKSAIQTLRERMNRAYKLFTLAQDTKELDEEAIVDDWLNQISPDRIKSALSLLNGHDSAPLQKAMYDRLHQAITSPKTDPNRATRLGEVLIEVESTVEEHREQTVPLPKGIHGVLYHRVKEYIKNVCDKEELEHILDQDIYEIMTIFPFQAMAVPFMSGTFTRIANGAEAALKNIKGFSEKAIDRSLDLFTYLLTNIMSSGIDNYAAAKTMIQVDKGIIRKKLADVNSWFYENGILNEKVAKTAFKKKVKEKYLGSVFGGGWLPTGNMPNLVLFNLGTYSMKTAAQWQRLLVRGIPSALGFAVSELAYEAEIHQPWIAERLGLGNEIPLPTQLSSDTH